MRHDTAGGPRRLVLAAISALLAAALLGPVPAISQPSSGCQVPAGGTTYTFDTTDAQVSVQLASDEAAGMPPRQITATGPTTVQSGPVTIDAAGLWQMPTEIVAMDLQGSDPQGNRYRFRESPTRASTGMVKQMSTAMAFPADSFFDVFVEVEIIPLGLAAGLPLTAFNQEPVRMQTRVQCIPPKGAAYESPGATSVALFTRPPVGPPVRVGRLFHAKHVPLPERPLFSVEAGGTLDPATVYRLIAPGVAVVHLSKAALGLVAGDDIDALSMGPDRSTVPGLPEFSPRLGSLGLAGTAVRTEATKNPTEAHGDAFTIQGGGANSQWLDEATLGLAVPQDDLDALADPGSGGLFFSLRAGSPTLAAIGATPGDILQHNPGLAPSVAIPHTALGLVPGDDLDALCNCLPPAGETLLFSLSAGSPSLATIPASPADILQPGPAVNISAAEAGLLVDDNVDGLKCMGMKPKRQCVDPVIRQPQQPQPTPTDRDGDGLSDNMELQLGTNPMDPDTDHDGIIDGQEVQIGTKPLSADSDGDGWPDSMEAFQTGTDPTKADTDGDGLIDSQDPNPFCH